MREATEVQATSQSVGAPTQTAPSFQSAPVPVQESRQEKEAPLTPAQREYLNSMRISWQQMLDGDGAPIEELLADLGVELTIDGETFTNDRGI